MHLILLIAALVGPAWPAERIPGLQRALIQVGRGHPRGVLPRLEAMLEAHPEHARLRAVAGIAYADVGLGPRAVELFEGADERTLVVMQSVARADALRDAGRPREAAALRWTALVSGERQGRLGWIAAAGAVDCLQADDLDCAARFVELGWAVDAEPVVWGALSAIEAEIDVQAGLLDEAEVLLAIAERGSGKAAHRAVARVALLLAYDEPRAAAEFATASLREVSHDVRLLALAAEAWRRAGAPDLALELCRSKRYTWKGEVVQPLLRQEEALALLALGEREEAERRAADLMAELPEHRAAAVVAAALGHRWD